MKDLREWLEKMYGQGNEMKINYDREQTTGTMYGNDECWDMNDFYQFVLTEDVLYKAYYDVPEGTEDMGSLDYHNPINLVDADAQYYIDYVI